MLTGKMFRDGIISAANNITNNRELIDALNVFPVPDGDTGTNMSMTITSAVNEVNKMGDDIRLDEVTQTCANALLRGARGNSGVILSLIFRGFAKAFKGLESADAKDIANAFRLATQSAYGAVMKPTEGTILTVVRKSADAAEEAIKTESDELEVCNFALVAAKEALADTPNLLPVLKKAGVVDAGGQGFVYILEGFKSVFAKNIMVKSDVSKAVSVPSKPNKSTVAAASGDIEFGYCSEFLVEKANTTTSEDHKKLREYLESIGDCVVVVDDEEIIKVHVHSNCPGNVIQEGLKYGQLINIKIDNMRYQHRNADEGISQEDEVVEPTEDYGFVAVCAGEGLEELFSDLGAMTVSGGQTMNPSTDDIYNIILKVPAKTVYVLPNNKNIIMAAQQAIPLVDDREVIVLETKTIPQGVSAMLAFNESATVDENTQTMAEAALCVETGLVTFAARDSEVDGSVIKKDQIMGLCNSEIKHIGDDKEKVAFDVIADLFDEDIHSIITIFYGDNVDENDANKIEEKLTEKFSNAEVSIVYGGQPVYYYIISVE